MSDEPLPVDEPVAELAAVLVLDTVRDDLDETLRVPELEPVLVYETKLETEPDFGAEPLPVAVLDPESVNFKKDLEALWVTEEVPEVEEVPVPELEAVKDLCDVPLPVNEPEAELVAVLELDTVPDDCDEPLRVPVELLEAERKDRVALWVTDVVPEVELVAVLELDTVPDDLDEPLREPVPDPVLVELLEAERKDRVALWVTDVVPEVEEVPVPELDAEKDFNDVLLPVNEPEAELVAVLKLDAVPDDLDEPLREPEAVAEEVPVGDWPPALLKSRESRRRRRDRAPLPVGGAHRKTPKRRCNG